MVARRAHKLKLPAIRGVVDKGATVREICRREGLHLQRTAFVGNDLNDISALMVVGLRLCPSDAGQEVRDLCDYVLSAKGGEGVAREIAARFGELCGRSVQR